MAVILVATFHVRPGRHGELFEALKIPKRIVERAGSTFNVRRQAFGAQPNDVVAVAQHADWAAFAKVRSDPELVQFLERQRGNNNPAADLVATAVYEDVAL